MAVPFIIPDDQNDSQVILVQLQTLISRLQMIIHNQQQQQQLSVNASSNSYNNSRVRSSSTTRQRTRDSSETSSTTPNQNNLSEVISNLSLFALSAGDQQSSSTYTAIPVRSPRTRGCSESSNCDVTKTATKTTFDQDWNKMNCNNGDDDDDDDDDENKEASSVGLLSKLTPASVSSCSLMTAVICFVGWHIFRGR
ncbi:uncharacterized protein LOC143197391 [Rhynchophorus ferrugineus]|uniref:Uncharacterized protein n=1 Tax=Rhynchophorus ferrugineus TaxID=354439 RepID=A0A834I061_RHYFE|nr:hypothetical protein GWI33_016398 [Rhynchophorus ferrugineus]